MITDEERRNVAANIRSAAERCKYDLQDDPDYDPFAALYTVFCGVRGYPRYKDILHLADLIDRPTCRIVHDENRDCDVCTNCSTSFELAEFDYADANVFEGYSYCPKCGAEVVEGD